MTNNPKCVILHCAYTPDSLESNFSVEDVRKWHLDRGFNDIGYHKYIDRSGFIQNGRDLSIVGAHCKAKGKNQDSIGICYEGKNFPSIPQVDSILNLYRTYRDIYQINYKLWFGHYEFDPENKAACPGFDMEFMRSILRKVA